MGGCIKFLTTLVGSKKSIVFADVICVMSLGGEGGEEHGGHADVLADLQRASQVVQHKHDLKQFTSCFHPEPILYLIQSQAKLMSQDRPLS